MVPDLTELGIKIAMGIDYPFGRSGAARGKEDGGGLMGCGFCRGKGGIRFIGEQLVQCQAAPESAFSHRYPGGDGSESPGFEQSQIMGLFNADESAGFALLKAGDHAVYPHARVHHHGNGPHLEKGKGDGEKIHARRYHQDGANPPGDAVGLKGKGQPVGGLLQLFEGHMTV